jgi:hypothetical protein
MSLITDQVSECMALTDQSNQDTLIKQGFEKGKDAKLIHGNQTILK